MKHFLLFSTILLSHYQEVSALTEKQILASLHKYFLKHELPVKSYIEGTELELSWAQSKTSLIKTLEKQEEITITPSSSRDDGLLNVHHYHYQDWDPSKSAILRIAFIKVLSDSFSSDLFWFEISFKEPNKIRSNTMAVKEALNPSETDLAIHKNSIPSDIYDELVNYLRPKDICCFL